MVSGGEDGSVRVWDLSSRRELYKFTGKGGSVHAVAVSPDRRWLAAGDAGGGLRLWSLKTHQERALTGHQSGIRSVAFSPDGRRLLSCRRGRRIVQWNVEDRGTRVQPPAQSPGASGSRCGHVGRTNGAEP